jgi:hypothetical protein
MRGMTLFKLCERDPRSAVASASPARTCGMRAHELGPAKYRPYSIICR